MPPGSRTSTSSTAAISANGAAASSSRWTGWPTFPMVFVKGVLVGGAEDLARLIEKGELPRRK